MAICTKTDQLFFYDLKKISNNVHYNYYLIAYRYIRQKMFVDVFTQTFIFIRSFIIKLWVTISNDFKKYIEEAIICYMKTILYKSYKFHGYGRIDDDWNIL